MDRVERTALVVRAVNVVLAIAVAALVWPLALLIAAAIWADSGRPILYSQRRVGRSPAAGCGFLGTFTLYKFRSMRPDAERHTGPTWSLPGDRRVTKLGRWLRLTHLDELPQLWNVLRGDMNLVGPRPERPEFVARLLSGLPDYGRRLRVRPGITGLAQLRQGPDRSVADVASKLRHDLEYVRCRCVWLDLRLILGTPVHVVREVASGAPRPIRTATRSSRRDPSRYDPRRLGTSPGT